MSTTPTPLPTSSSVVVTPSGPDNTTALQKAIDSVTFPIADGRLGEVLLDGYFRFSEPLRIGAEGTAKPVVLRGAGQAHVRWNGPATENYAIRYFGEGRSFAPRIENIFLDCADKCRGILLQHQAYAGGIHHCSIHNARQIGLDLVDCWGTEISHLVISSMDGMAVRGVGFSSSVLRLVKVGGVGNTWPDPLDASVKRYNGTLVQTPEDRRATISLSGAVSEVSNVGFEVCKYPGLPLLRFPDRSSMAYNIRREDCVCLDDWAVIGGVQFNVVS